MPGVQELLVKRKFMLDKYFTLEDQEFEVMEDGVKKMARNFRTFYSNYVPVILFFDFYLLFFIIKDDIHIMYNICI